jgi:hypothetical protein
MMEADGRTNKQDGGGGGIGNEQKEDFMRERSKRGNVVLHIDVCAGVYEPQHKTNGRQRFGEGQILRNKGIEEDKARAKGKRFGWCGGQSNKRAHKQKGASWKTISRGWRL